MRFKAIYADPPWSFRNWSASGERKNAKRHYDCLTIDHIAAFSVQDLAADDCALFLWVTGPFLKAAIGIGEKWGFSYRTDAFTWVKLDRGGGHSFGCGYWTRKNTEKVLLFTRGEPKRQSASVPELVVSPRSRHSEKPEEVATRIERLVPGPYVELFARRSRPGWTCLGNEISGNDLSIDIASIADQPRLQLEALAL
jgi:N6-adenosine-specific RNA methylase IME4